MPSAGARDDGPLQVGFGLTQRSLAASDLRLGMPTRDHPTIRFPLASRTCAWRA
jgi:hypothetical protein